MPHAQRATIYVVARNRTAFREWKRANRRLCVDYRFEYVPDARTVRLLPACSQYIALDGWRDARGAVELTSALYDYRWGRCELIENGTRLSPVFSVQLQRAVLNAYSPRSVDLTTIGRFSAIEPEPDEGGTTVPGRWRPSSDLDWPESSSGETCAHVCGGGADHICAASAEAYLTFTLPTGGQRHLPVCDPCYDAEQRALLEEKGK